MTGTSFADRPEWYTTRNCPRKAAATPGAHETSSVQSATQSSISQFVVPGLQKAEQKALSKELAMFFYNTGTSFQRVEEPHLLKAFKICRENAHIPS